MGKEEENKRRDGGRGRGGREGVRGWWGEREQGEAGRERGGESKGREGGSDDARQAESVSGGREG